MGKGHHHGGGWRGYPPYGYGYPWQAPATEVFVVDNNGGAAERDRRAMAHIMGLPKAKRAAAYRQIFGKEAPEGSLGGFELGQQMPWRGHRAQSRAGDALALGIFDSPTLMLPQPGSPEILGAFGGDEGPRDRDRDKGGKRGARAMSRGRAVRTAMSGGDCACHAKPMGDIPIVTAVSNALLPVFGTATTYVVVGGGAIGALYLLSRLMRKK